MAATRKCNHAYGLTIVHCPECGAHIASKCPDCNYQSRYDDEHRPGCCLEGVMVPPEGLTTAQGSSETQGRV